MQIIMTQAEIEEAVCASILAQISLAEGSNIKLRFKNTRGDDGLTATVMISHPGQATNNPAEEPKAPAEKETTTASKPKPKAKEEVADKPKAEKVTEEVQEEEPEETVAEESQAEDPESTVVEMAEKASAAAGAKSLFADLQKPVNGAK